MGLIDLPAEIQLRIFEDDGLGLDDQKALRLTARALCPTFTAAIFRKVPISKTKRDWHRFSKIASRPHLAKFVHEVLWYELVEDHRILCHSQGQEEGCWCEMKASEKFPVTTHELAPLAQDIFWLTPEICDNRHGTELSELRKEFTSLIDLLPNLESFISMPMPPRYVLSDGPYTFTAQLFYRCLGLTGPGFSRHSISSGFFHFLVPAMIENPDKIHRLHFIDQPFRPSMYNFTDPESPVFDNLTDLNLCLNLVGSCHDFSSCLQRARELRRLRLCFDRTSASSVLNAMVTLFGTEPKHYWPEIRTLELVRVGISPVGDLEAAGYRTLLALLREHAQTLRCLTLHECDIKRDVVEKMADIPGLTLKSLRVITSDEGGTGWVDEKELLAFVNGEDKSGQCVKHLQHRALFNTISTTVNPAMRREQNALASDAWDITVPSAANDNETYRDRKNISHGESVYALEKREDESPKWKFGQVGDDLYFWQSDGEDARETRTWRFTHRSGEVAYGNEPLEFFSDWESDSEEGDVAEAVPTGALVDRARSPGLADSIKEDELPEGAARYLDSSYDGFKAVDWHCNYCTGFGDACDCPGESDEEESEDIDGDGDGDGDGNGEGGTSTIGFYPNGVVGFIG